MSEPTSPAPQSPATFVTPVPLNVDGVGVYFNGFALAAAQTDATIQLLNGTQPVLKIQANFSTLKELVTHITKTITSAERATGVTFPPLSELIENQKKQSAEKP